MKPHSVMNKVTAFLISGFFLLSACNNTGNQKSANVSETIMETSSDVSASGNDIVLNASDNMKFDMTEIRVKEGETIRLTLHHTGKAPKRTMGHNFVLLKAGVSIDNFSSKAMQATDNDYIPENSDDVIVHTKLLGGGESDMIEFTAPTKGIYPFLCSFPGHAAIMNGKLIVK